MNDDLKAYVDGELPPDAAERLRETLAADPALALEGEEFRRLSAALRSLPEPIPVGQSATLTAITRRRPLWRGWTVALAGCAAVLLIVSTLPSRMVSNSRFVPAYYDKAETSKAAAPAVQEDFRSEDTEPEIPPSRAEAFRKIVEARGGKVERDQSGLKAAYPESAHKDLVREFDLPNRTPWTSGGIRLRVGTGKAQGRTKIRKP